MRPYTPCPNHPVENTEWNHPTTESRRVIFRQVEEASCNERLKQSKGYDFRCGLSTNSFSARSLTSAV